MGTPNANVAGKFAVDPSVTSITDFDSGSEQYEFTSESMRMVQSHVDSLGVRGTRSRVKDHVRIGQEVVGGSVSLVPTPVELDKWLPRILGAAESSDSFAVSETLPEFGCLFERGADRYIYTGCQVNRAVFTGAPGQLVGMTLDIFGKTEIRSATSFPGTVPAIDTGQPYVFSDSTFQLQADTTATECLGFTITIDNFLERRFANSVTASQIFATDRLVTLEMLLPYTADEIDLIDQSVAGNSGTLTLTNGGQSTLFTFANLKVPNESPVTPGRPGERTCVLRMSAYMSSSTRELVITHDSTA